MKPLDPIAIPLQGTRLIEASAGTGKTFAITTLYVRLVIERGLRVDQILVVTYTRAATAELRDRIRSRLRQALAAVASGGDDDDPDLDAIVRAQLTTGTGSHVRARLLAALRGFDQAAIYTIHSFCQRTLQDSAFESGVSFDTTFVTDQGPLVTEIAMDFWARELYNAPEAFVRSLQRPESPVTPTVFMNLARKAVGSREMPVLPDRPDIDSAAGERWLEAYATASSIWASERDAVIELLVASAAAGLKKNMYKPENIRGPWAQAMDRMLGSGAMGGALDLKVLDKFSDAGLAKGCKKNHSAPVHPLFAVCAELGQVAQEFAMRELALLLDLAQYAREELRNRKSAARIQSFDDLLYQLRDALRGPGGKKLATTIRTRFPAALIDEFQDTDAVQYEVFRTLYYSKEANEPHDATDATGTTDALCLFLIGDPKQAIYAFRGADIFTYMLARSDVGEASNTLGTNWRSDPSLIRGVNSLFDEADNPFIFDKIEFSPVAARPNSTDRLGGTLSATAPLQVLFVPRDGRTGSRSNLISTAMAQGELPQGIAGRIAALLNSDATIDGRQVMPGDIAVLCRTNRQASDMQSALLDVAVPSVLEGDASVFDSDQAAALLRVLSAMVDPGRAGAIKSALVTVMMGVSGDELCALRDDEDAWDQWVQLYRAWQRTWNDAGFVQAFRRMISDHEVDRRLLQLTDGERRLTNLYHLGELLQAEAMTSRAGPQALLRWFQVMCSDKSARADSVGDSSQIRLESDADAVKLVTIHKSKGLEYPIVYCPFLWDGNLLRMNDSKWVQFHDSQDNNRLKLDLDSAEHTKHKELAQREALAENLRLLYVALTRAKHMCTIVWGAFSKAGTSPLGYLLHQPDTFTTDPAGLKKLAKHIKALTDDQLVDQVEELVDASHGAIALDFFVATSGSPAAPYTPPKTTEGNLSCRIAKRATPPTGRTSSFSALVASDTAGVKLREHEHDHDADHDADNDNDAHPSDANDVPTTTIELPDEPNEVPSEIPLHDFPGGVRAGQMFHHIFENIDFCDQSAATLEPTIADALDKFDYDRGLAATLGPVIAGVLETPLVGHPSSMMLADLPASDRLVELEFTYPVAGNETPLTAASLADAFRNRADAPWTSTYPGRLARLGFRPLDGYLRGFADLVFRHDDRWYLVDYKSNFLGPNTADYEPAQLVTHMAHHHYFLQYHLYVVALHRYLRFRVKDYDYDRHFGGVYYLFLRGMAPNAATQRGVFHDRPPRDFVDRFSALIGDPATQGVRT